MKTNFLLSIVLFISSSVFAQNWTLDKAHAKLGFTVTHLLVSDVEGKFKVFDINITSSKDDFTDASVDLSADINSISTDNDYRDNDLKGEKFFNAKQFPTLSFKSTSLKKTDAKHYKLYGNLTMHGITKPVVLDVILNGVVQNPMNKKSVAGFKIKGVVKRSDFDIATSTPGAIVSDEVSIDANLELNK